MLLAHDFPPSEGEKEDEEVLRTCCRQMPVRFQVDSNEEDAASSLSSRYGVLEKTVDVVDR